MPHAPRDPGVQDDAGPARADAIELRLRAGRFYTPDAVVDLALALALGPPASPAWVSARIWDPTCGDGAFLRGARRFGAQEEHLVGSDLDADALRQLAAHLPRAERVHADLFDLCPSSPAEPDGDALRPPDPHRALGPFDLIVGNPPFVRAERVPAAERRRRVDGLRVTTGAPVTPGADAALLSLVQASRFLAPGGVLIFVVPVTLLDVAQGHPVRQWLRARFDVRALLDSAREPLFPDVAVNTALLVLQDRGERGADTVVAARLLGPPDAEVGDDARRAHPSSRLRVRRLSASRLADPRWSPLLRAPDAWFALLDAAGPALRPLGGPRGVLRLAYGSKVGIAPFFTPRDPTSLDGPPAVEADHRRPFLRTLRGIERIEVHPSDTTHEVFVVPATHDGDPASLPPGASAWVHAGAETSLAGRLYPTIPSVQGHRPWYRLPPLHTGPVLVPQFRGARHHVLWNPSGLPVNNSAWWGTFVDPVDEDVGVALLNSSLGALTAECLGRTNLGEGLLTLYGPELADLPTPDPRRFLPGSRAALEVRAAFAPLRARRVLPFGEEAERPDRAALDAAVLRGLGLPPELGATIRAAAVELLTDRLELAARRRSARRASHAP